MKICTEDMDAGISGVDILDADIIDAGGDMDCYRWSLYCSGQVLSSTESTLSGRLLIHTDTGTIIIGIRASDPVTLSELVNSITSVMSDMGSILQDTGIKGDDE